jgi:hypothetical protein
MNLIEIYIQEVTRRVPEKSREDIALELRSTIEDMLPEDYTKEEIKLVLEKLGNPAMLASGYRDQPMYLIGPRYFDLYVTLLKMILPIAISIGLIVMIAEYFISHGGGETVIQVVITIMGKGIGTIIDVGIQTFFWLTVVFAILERADKKNDMHPLSSSLKKWTPDDLKNIPFIPKKKIISKLEVFGYLFWTAIWATLYFYANHLVGIYEGNGNRLEFVTPVLNQEVLVSNWPIVLVVIGLEIALALYKFIKGQWTKQVAVFNTVTELIGALVFLVIISNPNLLHQEFIAYMTDLFTINAEQLKRWIVGGVISIYVVFAVFNVFDGFRKSRIH